MNMSNSPMRPQPVAVGTQLAKLGRLGMTLSRELSSTPNHEATALKTASQLVVGMTVRRNMCGPGGAGGGGVAGGGEGGPGGGEGGSDGGGDG